MGIPVIFSLSGSELLPHERSFFKTVRPAGFILFDRNIGEEDQLRHLIDDLKQLSLNVEQNEPLIMVDVEGGRVNRLAKFEYLPSARYLGDLFFLKKESEAVQIAKETAHKMSLLLKRVGFNSVCAPCADLYHPGLTGCVIGERAFSADPKLVVILAKIFIEELEASEIIPITKHLPGHGCVKEDSHNEIPFTKNKCDLQFLEKGDFNIFKNLSLSTRYAMLAHVVYPCLDPENAASKSSKVIKYIREDLNLKNAKFISDDICMHGLSCVYGNANGLDFRTELCLKAGCDFILHCSGDMDEMKLVVKGYEKFLTQGSA